MFEWFVKAGVEHSPTYWCLLWPFHTSGLKRRADWTDRTLWQEDILPLIILQAPALQTHQQDYSLISKLFFELIVRFSLSDEPMCHGN
jgi:hypothetical protein